MSFVVFAVAIAIWSEFLSLLGRAQRHGLQTRGISHSLKNMQNSSASSAKKKGVTLEDARYTVKNPLYLGCLLIKAGDADAMVAGALSPTSSVLRAAFQVLKTKPGISVVSGAFIMLLPDNCIYGEDHMLVFADCAVVPDPTKEELAQIAIATAKTTKDIAGLDPVVAMLSFSTRGSASHEKVDKVREANRTRKTDGPHPQNRRRAPERRSYRAFCW